MEAYSLPATHGSHFMAALCVVAMATTCVSTQPALTTDLKVRYFTPASLICDHQSVNISGKPDTVASISWIFPDGSKVDANSPLDHRRYEFHPPGFPATLTDQQKMTLAAYNLTVLDVNDDVFGYYTCVVVYNTNGIEAIRYGLNIDGADFSELMREYEQNAIVGGVAAAAMLVLVGGGCLIWNFRFSNRNGSDESGVEKVKQYNNQGFRSDIEMTGGEVDVTSEPGDPAVKL